MPNRGAPAGFNQQFDPRFGTQFGPQFNQGQMQPRKREGKMHGEIVSLRIELAAYFRRPNFAPTQQ
jgi:hypothetical protein